MNDQGTVNSQILDSVADVVTLTSGHAPAQAFGMLDAVMVETLGMAMYNAVSRQHGASMIGSAAVTAVCAKMLNAPFPLAPPTPKPGPPAPPHVEPLPPVDTPASAVIAAAAKRADAAVDSLIREAQENCGDVSAVTAALNEIVARANAALHPPAPPPAPAPTPTPTPAPVPTPPPASGPAPEERGL